MNKTEFLSYLSVPQKLNSGTSDHLLSIIKEFPYFQTAHLLLAKNLYSEKDIRYNRQLKIASIYSADRKALYRLIMQEDLLKKIKVAETIVEKDLINKEPEQLSLETNISESKVPLVSFLEKEILKEALASSYSLEHSLKSYVPDEASIEKKQPEIISQFEVKLNGKKTFSQWMQALSMVNSQKVETEGEKQRGQPVDSDSSPLAKTSQFDLLLAKLSKKESPLPSEKTKKDFFSPANIGRLSLVEDDKFITETLAKIYEQQGNYSKAITAYKNLSLKYPEKNSYFATRIQNLEKLIILRKQA